MTRRTGIVAAILLVLAHFAMLVGITTPEKVYFDEVHDVPAARQMLAPVMPEPMLNPMHPPLAKRLIAKKNPPAASGRRIGVQDLTSTRSWSPC